MSPVIDQPVDFKFALEGSVTTIDAHTIAANPDVRYDRLVSAQFLILSRHGR